MITLTIEDTVAWIAVIQGKKVKTAVSIPLPPGLVKDGIVTDFSAVGDLIKDTLETYRISEKQVIASVSGNHAIYRVARLPALPHNVLEEAASHEMEKAIPVPLAEMYTSWQASSVTHEEIVLSMVAIPRDNIDSVLNSIHHAGLNCKLMDLKPLALARVIDEITAIVINIQPRSFDIAIVVNGIPEIARTISFSEDSIPSQNRMNELKEELDRTVTFYNSSQQTTLVNQNTPLFISGDFQDMVAEKLRIFSGGLGYMARELPQLLNYPDDFNADEYAVNIGLALKQIKNMATLLQVNMNVIPMAYKPKKIPAMQVFTWLFIIAAIAILAVIGINTQQAISRTAELQKQQKAMQEQVSTLGSTKTDVDKYQASLLKTRADRDSVKYLLDTVAAQRNKTMTDMGKITGSLTGLIKPSGIVYGPGWTITGVARDTVVIFSYVQALKDSGSFNNVIITNMREKSINEWEFSLSMQ